MAKDKIVYVCSNCGHESMKWLGKCPNCNEWNTMTEEVVSVSKNIRTVDKDVKKSFPVLITDVVSEDDKFRIVSKDNEFNRVLGGGIVRGSIVLVGGEPGIGKSTLMLQISDSLSELKVLYVSGEESKQQIKMRYDRICKGNSNIYLLS
jgi:DNA repair protein RadA/Sms